LWNGDYGCRIEWRYLRFELYVGIVKSSPEKKTHEIGRTGDVISQCSTTQGGSKEVQTEGPIIAVAISGDERYLVTVGENKMLSLWQLPGLELINERWVFWLVVLLLLILSLSRVKGIAKETDSVGIHKRRTDDPCIRQIW